MAILAAIFVTSHSENPGWRKFYKFVPSLLLCYFIPSVFTSLGVIDPDESNLYYMASRYLLPASLVLLTLSIDIKAIMNLGWKAVAKARRYSENPTNPLHTLTTCAFERSRPKFRFASSWAKKSGISTRKRENSCASVQSPRGDERERELTT